MAIVQQSPTIEAPFRGANGSKLKMTVTPTGDTARMVIECIRADGSQAWKIERNNVPMK